MSYKSELNYSYTLGMSITKELLEKYPELVLEVYYDHNIKEDFYVIINKLCKDKNIKLINDDRLIKELSVKENCYVIAKFKKFNKDIDIKNNHLVLCNMDNDGVFGTILRSAISFNQKDIVLINPLIDIFDPKVVRSSMGAIFQTNIKIYKTLNEYFNDYKDHHPYLLSNKSENELSDISFEFPYSIIMDNKLNTEIKDIKKVIHINSKNQSLSLAIVMGITLHYLYSSNLSQHQ